MCLALHSPVFTSLQSQDERDCCPLKSPGCKSHQTGPTARCPHSCLRQQQHVGRAQGLAMSQSSSRTLLHLLLRFLESHRQRHSRATPSAASSSGGSVSRRGQLAQKRRKFAAIPIAPPAALRQQAVGLLQHLVARWPSMLLSVEALPQVRMTAHTCTALTRLHHAP